MSATVAWLATLAKILNHGALIAPRGLKTRELLHHRVVVDMRDPVVRAPLRKLSYKFMAAEALWILRGDDTVAGIAPFNPRIADFSDDGATFFGAYGPRVVAQLDYVVDALTRDRETRQAVLTTWRRNPPHTKDVPCTVALTFMIRDGRLNCHAFMRSSDAWLGLPYDAFNFSMIAARVACRYNEQIAMLEPVALGTLYLTAASAHLYAPNFAAAARCVTETTLTPLAGSALSQLVVDADWDSIENSLLTCRDHCENLATSPWRIRPC